MAIDGALAPYFPNHQDADAYQFYHCLKAPIPRLSISWTHGNSLRVSLFNLESDSGGGVGGEVVEVKAGNRGDREINSVEWRRIYYGSVTPFALLQSRIRSDFSGSKMLSCSPKWEYIMEYCENVSALLGKPGTFTAPLIEDKKDIVKKADHVTSLKGAWELLVMFYTDPTHSSLSEQLIDWLADYDTLFAGVSDTTHVKIVQFQGCIINLQVIEDHPGYWEVLSSALAVGWLEIVVKLLHLHGSYQLDQLDVRETENGLVEAVVVLISKMPRMGSELKSGKLGEFFRDKLDFKKAWERWRAQIMKLQSSAFWLQCSHRLTREGLTNLLQIMLGNIDALNCVTCNWLELFISHLLHVRPFTAGLETFFGLAQLCIQLKPSPNPHKLMQLLVGLLGQNTEVVVAECLRGFGPWLVVHAVEIMIAGCSQAKAVICEEQPNFDGISVLELFRLIYAQVLSSHLLTWQIAPVYLMSCPKEGRGLLEVMLLQQPIQPNKTLLKTLEICRIYELHTLRSRIMRSAGIHHWKHGNKGSGIFWFQQARDSFCLNKIASQLFNSIGKSLSDEYFKRWEGLIDLLSSQPTSADSLEFLCKYRDFKKSLLRLSNEDRVTAMQAVESLMLLMKNPSTPLRFLLPILHDSLKLLSWNGRPLVNVTQTNLLLNKLQELSCAQLLPGFIEPDLPPNALASVRLALAQNLARAILDE